MVGARCEAAAFRVGELRLQEFEIVRSVDIGVAAAHLDAPARFAQPIAHRFQRVRLRPRQHRESRRELRAAPRAAPRMDSDEDEAAVARREQDRIGVIQRPCGATQHVGREFEAIGSDEERAIDSRLRQQSRQSRRDAGAEIAAALWADGDSGQFTPGRECSAEGEEERANVRAIASRSSGDVSDASSLEAGGVVEAEDRRQASLDPTGDGRLRQDAEGNAGAAARQAPYFRNLNALAMARGMRST